MSRRSLATVKQASAIDPASLVATPVLRIPDRMVLDILMLLEIGLVVAAAALAKLLYIAFFLDSAQDHQPYMLAGLAGGIVIHYMMRLRGLHEPAAILGWRRRLGELLVAIGLSFLIADRARLPAQDLLRLLPRLAADVGRSRLGRSAAEPTPVGKPAALARLDRLHRAPHCRGRGRSRRAAPGGHLAADAGCTRRRRVRGNSNEGQGKSYATIADLINIGQRNQIDEVVVALSNCAAVANGAPGRSS